MTDPIVLESLTEETYQYLVQVQRAQNLTNISNAAQQVLEETCQRRFLNVTNPLFTAEHREQLSKIMLGLEQCQTYLSETLLTLHTLTALTPIPVATSQRRPRRKAVGSPSTKRRPARPTEVDSLSLDELRRGLTGSRLTSRLGTSAAAISRKRSSSNFGEWSQKRDPAAIAWIYASHTRRFHPVSLPSSTSDQI